MKVIILLFSWFFVVVSTQAAAPSETTLTAEDLALLARKLTNEVVLTPSPDDPNITRLVAAMLQKSHFERQPLNDDVSARFLDRYLDTLDNLRMYFLQTDLREFDAYRTTLDEMTQKGEIKPARVVFTRFIKRVHQQYDFITNLLATERFEFNDPSEYFNLNRKKAARPADLEDAKRVWRQRLRYEYLQEKLGIGRPEEIAKIVEDHLERGKMKELPKALQDKVSKEKAQEIVKFVEAQPKLVSAQAVADKVEDKLKSENAQEIIKLLTKRYTRLLRALHDYDHDDVFQLYLSALASVYDPHSSYMGHDELENFSIGMRLSLFGIGALLRSEDGYCKIQSLTPNGPAEQSKKLKPNDRIIAVGQGNSTPVDVVDWKLSKVVDLIRGPKGTEVRLTIIPADAADPSVRKVISLVRDEIKLEDQAAKARIHEMPATNGKMVRVGVVDLPSFYSAFELESRPKNDGSEQKSTTADVSRLIRKLVDEKVAGIVLDLRRNGGGSLEEAIRLTGLFIKEGPVVQVKSPEGKPMVEMDPDPAIFYDGPLVVLTSRFSASASEILAGALQDYGRAVIVGDASTHGKGTVQSLVQLRPFMRGQLTLLSSNDPGALKVTIRKFYRASGSSTQLKGVVPDIILPSIYNHAEVGEASLDNPMPWDTIEPAAYEPLNFVPGYVPALRRKAEGRVATDRDFVYLREEVERYKKTVAEKRVSLNENLRLKEKREADERAKARKKELAARPEPPGKIYEITLKLADEPGLPPPLAKTNNVKSTLTTTNSPVQAAAEQTSLDPTDPVEESAEAGDDKTPSVDIVLDETRRILLDLVTATQQAPALVERGDQTGNPGSSGTTGLGRSKPVKQ